jgi:hypothetical protein
MTVSSWLEADLGFRAGREDLARDRTTIRTTRRKQLLRSCDRHDLNFAPLRCSLIHFACVPQLKKLKYLHVLFRNEHYAVVIVFSIQGASV